MSDVLSLFADAIARRSGHVTVRVRCPDCLERTGKPDRRGSLSLRTNNGFFRCFKCGLRGRVKRDFLSENGLSVDRYDDVKADGDAIARDVALPDEFAQLYSGRGWHDVEYHAPRDYVERVRRVDPSLWPALGIGACLSGKYARRVVVPVIDSQSRNVGFVARDYSGRARIKYMLDSSMDRRLVLYNEQALSAQTDAPLYVVEGVFDAIALWPDAVATLGDVSSKQLSMIADTHRPVVVVFDGDAWCESVSLAMQLRLHGVTAGAVQLEPGQDPDEVERTWLDDEARKAIEESEVQL